MIQTTCLPHQTQQSRSVRPEALRALYPTVSVPQAWERPPVSIGQGKQRLMTRAEAEQIVDIMMPACVSVISHCFTDILLNFIFIT